MHNSITSLSLLKNLIKVSLLNRVEYDLIFYNQMPVYKKSNPHKIQTLFSELIQYLKKKFQLNYIYFGCQIRCLEDFFIRTSIHK